MSKIYLDNAATTKPNMLILNKAVSELEECFFNPSALYSGGLSAKKILDNAREYFESLFFSKKVIFTSCGTEADNTAIFSFGMHGNIVTTMGEHSAVYESFQYLKQKGVEVRNAKLKFGGEVDEEDLLSKIDENTSFVSVVHVNNETGAINDINHLAKRVKEKNPKVIFHSDGVQAFGKIFSDIQAVDLYSVSAHKICGLKGTGALFYNFKLHVKPLVIGGGQEGGLRSGTENVLGIKIFADCTKYAKDNEKKHYQNAVACKKALLDNIDTNYLKVISSEFGSPYIVTLSCYSLRGAVMQSIMDDEGYYIGTGSACSSKAPHSRVISSFTKDKKLLDGVIRVSFAFDTKVEDVLNFAQALNRNVKKLNGKINI